MTDYAFEFAAMRKRVLIRAVISFSLAVLGMFSWFWLYSLFSSSFDYGYLIGWAFIAALWYFGYINKLEKEIVCPACKRSLSEFDGWNLFIRCCPHCQISLHTRKSDTKA